MHITDISTVSLKRGPSGDAAWAESAIVCWASSIEIGKPAVLPACLPL